MKNPPTTLQQIRPQLPVRLFNGFGALLEKTRIRSTRLVATDLIETAKRRCGLDDFGEGDFSEALSRLLQACQDEARLNLIGKIALKVDVLEILGARLQMERDRQLYPKISRQEIREPLFIVGLPRSGTSVLHRLLAADPEHRSPLMWEVRSPSPPTAADEQRRIQRATQSCNFFNWLVPKFRYVHTVGAEVPQECVSLMTPTFLSDQFDTMYYVPSYRSWFFRQDLRPAYEYHRRFLQHLQFRTKRPTLDPESAYSHVCDAIIAVGLSGCIVCADPSDASRCNGLSIQSGNDPSQRRSATPSIRSRFAARQSTTGPKA